MRAAARLRQTKPVAVTAAVCVALFACAGATEPDFLSLRMLCGLVSNQAVLGIVAVGMTFVILSGGIDLSAGAVLACASIGTAFLIERAGWNPAAAMATVIVAGAMWGGGMGAMIHHFRMPAFIVTLGGMFIARGVAFSISRESIAIEHSFYESAHALPASAARALGASDPVAQQISFHVPTPTIFLILLVVAAILVLGKTRFGRAIYAVGGSEHAAHLMGVDVGRTRKGAYAISGGCAGLAGVVHTLSLFSGDPSAGIMLELDAIAAVVIGGTLLSGGVGTIGGTALGILTFGVIDTWIMIREGLNSAWTRIIVGAMLLGFILIQQALLRRK